jgi:hypothetical protein
MVCGDSTGQGSNPSVEDCPHFQTDKYPQPALSGSKPEMSANQKRYIDHPLFGRIELDDTDDEAVSSTPSPAVVDIQTPAVKDCSNNPIQTKNVVSQARSSRSIIDSMKSKKGNVQAQEQGCLDLLDTIPSIEGEEYRRILLAMGPEWQQLENVYNRIAEEGGISVALDAMRTHKKSDVIQEHGCHILRLLSRTNANEENISAAKGIDAMVDALKQHKNSPAVQTSALRALWNFIFTDSNKLRVRNLGGVLPTLESLGTYRYPPDAILT